MTSSVARVRSSYRRGLPISLAIVMSVFAARAGGQEFRATMTGRVTDAQGAVVPGVTIAVTNIDTNVSLTR